MWNKSSHLNAVFPALTRDWPYLYVTNSPRIQTDSSELREGRRWATFSNLIVQEDLIGGLRCDPYSNVNSLSRDNWQAAQ